jgi:16S rRNA C1402 N4-methylase RsmH
MGQLYQAVIDAALYVEAKKPQSTISYITNEGESAFVTVNGTDLRFRDLKIYLTNRPEDRKAFEEIRGLSQAVLQNGGSLHDVIELYSTNSMRQMKKVFKTLKERQEQLQNTQMQQKQQELEQQQQQAQAQIQLAQQQSEEKIANILWEYGDEKQSNKIAEAVCKYRKISPINTTLELAEIVKQVVYD